MELRSYLSRVWKFMAIVVVGVAASALVAFVITSRGQAVYTADARVVVKAGLGTEGESTISIEMAPLVAQTYAVLATTRPVLLDVIQLAALPYSPSEVLEGLSVVGSLDTPYLVISMTDADPERAAATANAVADVLVEMSATAPSEPAIGVPAEEVLAIVERAAVPEDPSGPRVLYNTMIAAAAALVGCLALLAITGYLRQAPGPP